MKKLFKNAKIGDKYITNSGKTAVYFHQDPDDISRHFLIIEGRYTMDKYEGDGRRAYSTDFNDELAIVKSIDKPSNNNINSNNNNSKNSSEKVFDKRYKKEFSLEPDKNDPFYQKILEFYSLGYETAKFDELFKSNINTSFRDFE